MSTLNSLTVVNITIFVVGIIFVALCVFNGVKKLLRD